MKKIEELGISPWPWKFSGGRSPSVLCGTGGPRGFVFPVVCQLTKESNLKPMKMRNADARLMAEAPEMYECLREAVANHCHGCICEEEWDGACTKETGACFVQRWRKALERAGGAE